MVGSFPPNPSGIADYNYYMTEELAKKIEIIYLTNQKTISPVNSNIEFRHFSDYDTAFRKSDMIHFQFGNNPFDSFVLTTFKKSLNYPLPKISTLHDMNLMDLGTMSLIFFKKNDVFFKILPIWKPLNFVIKNSNKIIIHSNYAKNYFLKNFGYPEKFNVILHGMPVNIYDQYHPKNKNTFDDNFLISSFGYVYPRKGYEDIIKALKLIQEKEQIQFKYIIIGGNFRPYQYYLDLLIAKYNLKNSISFVGYVNKDELGSYFKNSQIFIQPRKHASEGCSGSLLHALMSKIPVLASDTGYHSEYIINNKTGLLVKHSPENIMKGIMELHNNKEMRIDIGNNAYNWCKENLDWKIVIKQYIDLYEEFSR